MKAIRLISFLLLISAVVGAQNNLSRFNYQIEEGLFVNTVNLNLFHLRKDYSLKGPGEGLDFSFYYNSGNRDRDDGYGKGWSFTYNWSYDIDNTGPNPLFNLHRDDGQVDEFEWNGSSWLAPTGVFDVLEEYNTDQFRLTDKHGKQYFFDDNSHQKLTSIVDRNGNTTTIAYSSGLPSSVTDAAGRAISLTFASGHLTELRNANVSPNHVATYTYDANSHLISHNDTEGNTTQYTYDSASGMSGISPPSGGALAISHNACKTSSVSSSKNQHTFLDDPANDELVIIEGLNVTRELVYSRDGCDRIKSITNKGCCGGGMALEYDANDNIVKMTDANNNVNNYTYDAKGNILSQTDPLSNSENTIYDPTFNLPSSFTDKGGNVVSYVYDANGNLLSETFPGGIVQSYTYDAQGSRLTSTDGNSQTTTATYDANGYRITLTDPLSHTYTYGYDGLGNVTSVTDPIGNSTNYTYDSQNRLLQRTDANANTTTFTYDSHGNRTSITDADSKTTTFTYDAFDRRVTETAPDASSSSWTYDEHDLVTSFTNPNGHTSTFEYDALNRLVREVDPLGSVSQYEYDSKGNRTSESNPNGCTTTYTYDGLDRIVTITDPGGGTTTNTYDSRGNRLSITDPNSHLTSYTYDALNRVITVTDDASNTTTFEYDNNSNNTKKTDAASNALTLTYDANNRRTTITDPLSNVHTFAYDSRGNLTTHTLPTGDAWTFTYDARNFRTTESNPEGEVFLYTYTTNGDIASISRPSGQVVSYTYDDLYRPLSNSDQNGTIKSTTYDDNGNVLSEEDGLGNTLISMTYDAADRVITETDGLGNTHQYIYDNIGNVLRFTDRNNNTNSYTYDCLNRKISSTNPLGQSINYTYDAAGNLATETDEGSNTTTYTYDGLDRLVTETYPDATTRSLTYDVLGNVVSRTGNDGAVTSYTYDARSRLTLIDRPGANDDSYTYDALSQIVTASNPDASLSYTYDKIGRILSETLNSKTTTYTYDAATNKVTTTYPGGRAIVRESNLRNQLSALKEGGSSIATYTYDGASRLTSQTYSNGTASAYTYNGNFYITQIEHTGPGGLIAGFASSYDNAGNKILEEFLHQSDHSEQYLYDSNNQLTQFRRGSIVENKIPVGMQTQSFNYDARGNRTTDYSKGSALLNTFTSNNLNQYTAIVNSATTINPGYDLNGNWTTDGTNTYGYDEENRLTSISGAITATYKYDPLSRRISKTTGAATTNYYYDGERVIEERDGTDAVIATYVYGESLDDVVSMQRGGADYFYHSNTTGSTMAITNAAGALVEQYEYDAFGQPTIYDPLYTALATSAISNPYLFTGRRWEDESGLYYYRARYYDGLTGRFLSRDPLGSWDDVNLYKYAENDPLNIVDPHGTAGKYIHWTPSSKPAKWKVVGKSTDYRAGKTIKSYLMVNCCCIENSYDKAEEVTTTKKNQVQVFWRLKPSWVALRNRLRIQLRMVNGYIEQYNEEVKIVEDATDENFGTKAKLKIAGGAILGEASGLPSSSATDVLAGDGVSAESAVDDVGSATATYVAGPAGGAVWGLTFGLGRSLKKAWALFRWKNELKEKKKKVDERIRKYKEMERDLLRRPKWDKKTEVIATDETEEVKCTNKRLNLSTKQVPLSNCKK